MKSTGTSMGLSRGMTHVGVLALAVMGGLAAAQGDLRERERYAGYDGRSVRQQHPQPAPAPDPRPTSKLSVPASPDEGAAVLATAAAAEPEDPAVVPAARAAAAVPTPPARQSTPQAVAAAPPALSELIGKPLVNQRGQNVGRVAAIVRRKQDHSLQAVVASGGFFGLGSTRVVVPLEQVRLGEGHAAIDSDIGSREIRELTRFDKAGYEAVELTQRIPPHG